MPFDAIKPPRARLSPHSSLHLRAYATFAFNHESKSIYFVCIDEHNATDRRQWFRQLFLFPFVVVMSRRSRSIWLTTHFMEDLIFGGHRIGAAARTNATPVSTVYVFPSSNLLSQYSKKSMMNSPTWRSCRLQSANRHECISPVFTFAVIIPSFPLIGYIQR